MAILRGGGGGYSGHHIYQMVYPNAQYSSAMSTRGEGAEYAANGHDDAAIELAGIVESLDESWRGPAAEGAAGELKLLQQTSADTATKNLAPASESMRYQSETHEWTRHTLEPMESQPEQASILERVIRPGSQEQNNAEWQEKNTHNIEAYSRYSDATNANSNELGKDFPKISKSTWNELGEQGGNNIGTAGNPGITSPSGSSGGSGGSSPGSAPGSSPTTPSLTPPGSDSGGSGSPDGSRTLPDGTRILPDGTKILPDGTRILPDGTRVLPDGTRILPDGTRVLPDGTRISPDGSRTLPDGTRVLPDGTQIKPDGTKILPDGTIVRPNGQIVPPGNTTAAGLTGGADAAPVGMFGSGGAPGAGTPGGGAAGGFGPGGGAVGGGAALGGGGGAGGAGGMAAKGGMGAGGMGRGGMGGMMGGGGAGRGGNSGGDDEKQHQDQYYIKQELDPGLHVEYDEFGDKLIDDSTGMTVVPPVIGE